MKKRVTASSDGRAKRLANLKPFKKGGDPRRNNAGRSKVDLEWKAWCQQFDMDEREHIKRRAKKNDKFLMFLIEQGRGKAVASLEVSGQVNFRIAAAVILDALEQFPEAKGHVLEALQAHFQPEPSEPEPRLLNS